MGEGDDQVSDIVLKVPSEPDFVTLVRIAARIVAGRAGQDADSRSRLQADVGTAFFALTEGAPDGRTVSTRLRVGDEAVRIELAVDLDDPTLAAKRLDTAGIGHETSADGRTLRARLSS